MTAHYRVAGVWKEITEMYYRTGGVWKEITEGHTRVSGVWKLFFASFPWTILVTNQTVTDLQIDPANSTARVQVQSDGDFIGTGSILSFSPASEVATPKPVTGADLEVQLTVVSGSNPSSGPAINTWHNLGTTRTWDLDQNIPGVNNAVWRIHVGIAGESSAQDTGDVTVQAQVDVI